jgi:hypothetical protein
VSLRKRVLAIVAILLSVAVYALANSKAHDHIMAEMTRRQVERCISPRIGNCDAESRQYVRCSTPVAADALEFWWDNRGSERLQAVLQAEFTKLGGDIERMKQWVACRGLLVPVQFESMNISSPALYGSTLFGQSIPYFTYGSSLEVKKSEIGKLNIRVGFTYF